MDWIVVIGLLIILILLVFVYFFCTKFRIYAKDSWPNLLFNFIFVLVGAGIAIWGVSWAVQKDSERSFNTQLDIFKRYFNSIVYETGVNQASLKLLKKTINQNTFSLILISADVSESLIMNPLINKFAGEEYLLALSLYLTKVGGVNRTLELLYYNFKQDRKIKDENIDLINMHLDDLLYYTNILQYQSQYYVSLYGDEGRFRPGNQEQILKWISKEENLSASDIEKRFKDLNESDNGK